jgi:hypothetical protein
MLQGPELDDDDQEEVTVVLTPSVDAGRHHQMDMQLFYTFSGKQHS